MGEEDGQGTGDTGDTILPSGDQGDSTTFTWQDSLSADHRGHKLVSGKKDDSSGLDGLVKEAIHAQELIGRRGIIPPGKDATVEDYAKFYTELGRPEDIAGYELSEDVFEKGTIRDRVFEETIIKAMFDGGAPKTLMERTWASVAEATNAMNAAIQTDREQNIREAKAEISMTFGSAEAQKLALAADGFNHVFEDHADLIRELVLDNGSRLGDNVTFIKGLAKLGEQLVAAEMIEGRSMRMERSPADARVEEAQLMADKQFVKAWTDKRDPGHVDAMAKMNAIHEAISG